jgi:hypothetical protein
MENETWNNATYSLCFTWGRHISGHIYKEATVLFLSGIKELLFLQQSLL